MKFASSDDQHYSHYQSIIKKARYSKMENKSLNCLLLDKTYLQEYTIVLKLKLAQFYADKNVIQTNKFQI